jgi:hypothetical protein
MFIEYLRPHKPAGFVAVATVTNATAQSLTIPTDARYAIVKVLAQPVRYRDDGTAPTSVSGYEVLANGTIELISREQLAGFQVIAKDTSAGLEVLFYKI